MKTASKPLIVNVTAEEKRHIARMANAWGISMEAFMRRAAMSYVALEERAMLERMTDLLNKSTTRANSAVDAVLGAVEASNLRIDTMEKNARQDP